MPEFILATTQPGLQEIAEVAARALNWSADQTKQEMDRVQRILERDHHMNFNQYSNSPHPNTKEVHLSSSR